MEKIGKYRIKDVLGKGAMGIVYKALDPYINRTVAIKTIRFDLVSDESEKEELVKRFLIEAQAAGKLSHPNIITVFDIGREDDLIYSVMQYIQGTSLETLLSSNKQFSTSEIVNIMSQLCSALDYAHQNGVIHRDIKPANIILDSKGKPYIGDFGIAKLDTVTIAKTSTRIGTPNYMSPEQVKGNKVDNRSDIFSLGVVFFECFTGKKPFPGEDLTALMYQIVHDPPAISSKLKKKIPLGFERIIDKALEKNPDDRYSNCRQMRTDLLKTEQLIDETYATGYELNEIELKIEEKKKRRGWLWALLLCIVIAGATAYLLRYRKQEASSFYKKVNSFYDKNIKSVFSSKAPASDSGKQDVENQKKEAIPDLGKKDIENQKTETIPPDPLKAKEDNLSFFFAEGDFTATIKLAEEILAEDQENRAAKQLLDRAKKELKRKETDRIIAASRQEIFRLIERQRTAEKKKDSLQLLADVATKELKEQRKSDLILLFNYYDDIESVVSNISIQFKNLNKAEVHFHHILTGIYKKTGLKRVLFNGTKTWKLEKQQGAWKIVAFGL